MPCLLPPACIFCAHYHLDDEAWEKDGDCAAFDEIPADIMLNGAPHDAPRPGDGGIFFTPTEDPELRESLIEVNQLRAGMGKPPFGGG